MNSGFTGSNTNVAEDLAWMDMLKGVAIIGVVLDHWMILLEPISSSPPLYSLFRKVPVGTPVHLFFLLSGFGLTMSYLSRQHDWSWGRWAWRRITKIVVPYWLAVLFQFMIGILALRLFPSVNLHFSWKSLLAYLTFTRNSYPPSWEWNIALWFMPVIIGLYICFPLLVFILKKWGAWVLCAVTALMTYGSISMAALLSGRYLTHSEAIFLFFTIQFALGMALASVRHKQPRNLDALIGVRSCIAGCALYFLSWGLKTHVPHGNSYNDALTTGGVFLVLLNVIWVIRKRAPVITRVLGALGKESYFIFLIHYPIVALIIRPLLRSALHPIMIVGLGFLYIAVIYAVCSLISGPMDRFTSWLFRYRRSLPEGTRGR